MENEHEKPLKSKPNLDSLIASFAVEGIRIPRETAERIAREVDEELEQKKREASKVRNKSDTDIESLRSSFRVEGVHISQENAEEIAKKVNEKLT
ncbi:MAG TPA: hypothetical protein VFO76_07170 [Candidatus Kapabacteria bacterium]|nr:hypothetical protein [Candidatus Kapabacteria bacterium]